MVDTYLPEIKTAEARQALADAVRGIFTTWGINEINQSALLGFSPQQQFKANTPLPDNPVILERVGHIMAIARALDKMFPYDVKRRAEWVLQPVTRLNERRPIEIMLQDLEGIKEVRQVVESLKQIR